MAVYSQQLAVRIWHRHETLTAPLWLCAITLGGAIISWQLAVNSRHLAVYSQQLAPARDPHCVSASLRDNYRGSNNQLAVTSKQSAIHSEPTGIKTAPLRLCAINFMEEQVSVDSHQSAMQRVPSGIYTASLRQNLFLFRRNTFTLIF